MASLASSTVNQANSGPSSKRKRVTRSFAPLNDSIASEEQKQREKLEGIVFDVDGTLCKPQNYMFSQMREALQIPKSVDILAHLHSLPKEDGKQDEGFEKIRSIEREAMAKQVPQPGLTELMDYLRERKMRRGICTRNFDMPVQHLLSNFLPHHTFDPILTRDFHPPKPDPAGIKHIAATWGFKPRSLNTAKSGGTRSNEKGEEVKVLPVVMVGDSIDDMAAGRAAGAMTVLLANSENETLTRHDHTDVIIWRLDELVKLLEEGLTTR